MTTPTPTVHTGALSWGHHGLEVDGENVDDDDLVVVTADTLQRLLEDVFEQGKAETSGADGNAT